MFPCVVAARFTQNFQDSAIALRLIQTTAFTAFGTGGLARPIDSRATDDRTLALSKLLQLDPFAQTRQLHRQVGLHSVNDRANLSD